MKNLSYKLFVFLLSLFFIGNNSCTVDTVVDPNNPSLGSVSNNATLAEIQVLVTGLEARHRGYFGSATQMFGSFGREVWAYFGSDPRFISHWLGIASGQYTDFFASAGTYVTPYLAVKQANILIQAAERSSNLSAEQANAIKGFAKTIKAHQLLFPLLQQWNNGIRIDVEDPLNPGPVVGKNNPKDNFTAIMGILNEGLADLNGGGSSLPFRLSAGYAGFNTVDGIKKVNRALAARIALYAENWNEAQSALGQSFLDMNVDASSASKMLAGPAHVFGEAPDINNPLYFPLDRSTTTILICHPAWVEDIEPGDTRLAKVAQRVSNPASNPGLRDAAGNLLLGEYQDARWVTNTAPIPYIRNEELILIQAEVHLRLSKPNDAINTINVIRKTHGLANYSGGNSTDEILEEILHQRRYSLWAEAGHRWVDLRRTGKLDAAHVDLRDTGTLFTQVEKRTTEINWDGG